MPTPPNKSLPLLLLVCLFAAASPVRAAPDAPALYKEHCVECHGADRFGGTGPALLPENLGRLRPQAAAKVIAEGRAASQMPGFADRLDKDAVEALAKYIFTAVPVPAWGEKEIAASRIVHAESGDLPAKPVHGADPLNLFTVVEIGDHHVTILDGDRFEPLWRFQSRYALHGGAKYSPDGRFVYLASRDGWVSKYDLHGLKPVAETRVAINTRNIAVSGDGRTVAAGNGLPPTIVILDAADLTVKKIIPVAGDGGKTSRVSAVYDAAPRNSFIAALRDIPELWEISYLDNPPPVAKGLIHNYQEGQKEGAFDTGPFPVRRIKLDESMEDFFFDQAYTNAFGASREGNKGQVVNLNVGRRIAQVDIPGMPHLGSGITFQYQGRPVLATPHIREGTVSVVDMKTWTTIKQIKTPGPGFFMRSHENTPYAWTDSFLGGPAKDTMHVIDKRTLEIVRGVTPQPGKTAAHVEFTRDGRFALVSVWEDDGALVIYDAATFKEVKRLAMKKPSGKYNVHNKITRSEGTSH
ncbi:MAG: cytochrome C oxidase Cbb3 [Alphaproteobacteria bacterium]|nr:cytochrome C oxidase Cbb3 [Alphaproteobacteria bacterium]